MRYSGNFGDFLAGFNWFKVRRFLLTLLKNHADALNKSAEASEKHAKSLTTATIWLVIATFVLACVSIIQIILSQK